MRRIPGIPLDYLDQTDKKQAIDYGTKMNSLLLVVFVIAGAIPASKQAGYSSSYIPDAPGVGDFPCNVVQGKKPWCVCRSSVSSDVVDLSSLGTEKGNASLEAPIRSPEFISNEVDGWRIAWTPCEDFDLFTNITQHPDKDEMACKGVGFARYSETSAKICHGYGSHRSSARFYSNGYDPEHFHIEFVFSTPDHVVRNGRIWLICTAHSDKNILTYHGDQSGIEIVTFSSKCNCPNLRCTAKIDNTGKSYHLGGGAIAGIVVGTIALIALILSVRYRRKLQRTQHPVQESGEHDERHPLLM